MLRSARCVQREAEGWKVWGVTRSPQLGRAPTQEDAATLEEKLQETELKREQLQELLERQTMEIQTLNARQQAVQVRGREGGEERD